MLAFWLAVLVVVGAGSQAVKEDLSDAFNVPGTESQDALDLLDERFPGTGGATARVVFAAPPGHTLAEPQYKKVVQPTIDRAEAVPQALTTGKQFAAQLQVSKDKKVAFSDLQFAVPVEDLKDSTKDDLERVAGPARKAGLEVEFSGGVVSTSAGGGPNTEAIGVIVAFFVLLVVFGGAGFTAAMPLATALIGVAIGISGINALTSVVELNDAVPTVALMLGLAVGIDYALFIVSRHRQNLDEGLNPEEAAARAVATAGSAVIFAGVTVIIALVGLLVVGIPFLSWMGLAAAGTVAVAVLIALTLLPALLGLAGQRAGRGRRPSGETMGHHWGRLVTGRPLIAIVAVLAVVVVCALPALDLKLNLPDDSTKPKNTTERKSYDLLAGAFGPGFTGPLTTVIDFGDRKNTKQIANDAVQGLKKFPDVAAVSEPVLNEDGSIAIIIVTPASAPSSDATKDLVDSLRARADQIRTKYGINAQVTGNTAINIDTSDKLTKALPVFLVVVVGLALLLLMLVFRSVPVPLKAVIGFLFTIAAALGAVVWIFQQGHAASLLGVETTSPVISFLPVLMIAILFGLAMDYEVFLVSRMRESFVHTGEAVESTVTGFQASARVVTAAGLIMIAVFSGFILDDDVVIQSIGFALAFGVLIDAFFVRMTLVPAVLALLGNGAWWLPPWLERKLPNLDIEGEKVLQDLEAGPAAVPEPDHATVPAGGSDGTR